jgi:hypothetical protein
MAESLRDLTDRLRATHHATAEQIAGLREADLTREGIWRRRPAGVRDLIHRMMQHDEEHLVHLAKTLDGLGIRRTEAQRALGQAQITRGELESLLVGLDDSVLDQGPGGDEWPVRRVLGHIAGVEMRLIAETAAALDGYPRPQDAQYLVTKGAQVSGGDFAHLHNQLHRVRAELIERLSSIPDSLLDTQTRWFDWTVDLRFRLLDFAAHEREHIVHLKKTLQGIGRQQSEAEMLAGRAWNVYGQLMALLVGLPDEALDRAPDGEWSPRQILEHLIAEDRRHIERILQATSAVGA